MNSDRAALIAAILAHPEEDTPRLACADWFEEQGGEANIARADFIRTQIERANFPPTDPRQSELYARELRLLKKYATVWCGSHFVFKKCRFRRGFVEYVHLHLRHFLFHRRQMLALEPVRDISLTGWMRATDDLVKRVAACEEWKHIETLRIHHQGPHKDPQSCLVTLIESPHLIRLQSLWVSQVVFTNDARRRYERASVIRQLRELTLPYLDSFPQSPGDWFSDGAPTEPWENLRVLRLRGYRINADLFARLAAMPFWNRLTELDVSLGWSRPPEINALRNHLPNSLRVLRLSGDQPWEGGSAMPSLCERIAQLPLLGLHIANIPMTSAMLRPIFGASSMCELTELTLSGCGLTTEGVRIIAGSPRVRDVWSLNISNEWQLPELAAKIFFESENFRSVAQLNLNGTSIGAKGANALAAAEWTALRLLEFSLTGIPERNLAALFASLTFRNLVSLSIQGESNPDLFAVVLVNRLTALPRLASLKLQNDLGLEAETVGALQAHEPLAWFLHDQNDQENWGGFNPNVLAPLDDELSYANQW